MKTLRFFFVCLIFIPAITFAQNATEITIGSSPGTQSNVLSLKPQFPKWTGTPMLLRSQAYQSDDLLTWEPVGEPRWIEEAQAGQRVVLEIPRDSHPRMHYRLGIEPKFKFLDKAGGEGVPSYRQQFEFFLRQTSGMTNKEFETQYGLTAPPKEGIDWDVTEAEFWDAFNTSPAEHNQGLPADDPERRLTDFRLQNDELEIFKRQGMVVTDRLQTETFVDMFYDIWTDDLPVYFSADAALHAWHRSYDLILQEVELISLHPLVKDILAEMRAKLPGIWETHQDGPLAEALRDTDFYLTIAASLIQEGQRMPDLTIRQPDPLRPMLESQTSKVNRWYEDILEHTLIDPFSTPFGEAKRVLDFTQFEARGRYEDKVPLESYFRTLIWLGFVDFRLGAGSPRPGSQHDVAVAACLSLLLEASDQMESWRKMESAIAAFVGLSDSMTPPQMLGLLEGLNLRSFESFETPGDIGRVQEAILTANYGVQEIPGPGLTTCEGDSVPARSFTFFGQRFTPDSWALSQSVYDRLPVYRRVPSSLDVAFGALGNRYATGWLAHRMRDTGGMPFRDGYPYQEHLAATYHTIEAQEPAFWQSNLYQGWLGALRALSLDTPARMPDTFRTEAFAARCMNTQLASWTQLRHDTLLYVKQSYTPGVLCDYPAGYIEPVPDFWKAMADLAKIATSHLTELPIDSEEREVVVDGWTVRVNGEERLAAMRRYLESFESTMTQLARLSEHELSHTAFSDTEVDFMKSLVESTVNEYTGVRQYSGWYPALYFHSELARSDDTHHSDVWDPLVADVHTDLPDPICTNDPGGILHQAVGNVNLMMIAVNHGERRCVFAGPVFSYYEIFTDLNRMTDSEWKAKVTKGDLPPTPEWTASFMPR